MCFVLIRRLNGNDDSSGKQLGRGGGWWLRASARSKCSNFLRNEGRDFIFEFADVREESWAIFIFGYDIISGFLFETLYAFRPPVISVLQRFGSELSAA